MHTLRHLALLALLLGLIACSGGTPEHPSGPQPMEAVAQAPATRQATHDRAANTASTAPVRRYLELRHELQIQTATDGVEAAWRSANEACAAADCEVLAASLQRDDERRPARATLAARVPPQHLDAFLARLGELGTIGRHDKTTEDRTEEVVDTEARIANMATFRDHLRTLMASPGAKLKDLIEVERELVRVQSELDSLAARRKALANQTDKVHVSLSFVARATVLEAGMWSPVHEALLGAGHTLSYSVSMLISLVVALAPWALLLAAVGLGMRVAWRRWKRRPAA
jgi:hypothetical protein